MIDYEIIKFVFFQQEGITSFETVPIALFLHSPSNLFAFYMYDHQLVFVRAYCERIKFSVYHIWQKLKFLLISVDLILLLI